jgi:hypothetical protein
MAIVMQHRFSGERCVFLGARPDNAWSVLVCKADGALDWLKPEELVVVSVDGQSPAQLTAAETYR